IQLTSSPAFQAWREEKERQNKTTKDPFGVLSGAAPTVSSALPTAGNERSQGGDKTARNASPQPASSNAEASGTLIASMSQPLKERLQQPWHDEGGNLVTDLMKSRAYADFGLPARVAIEIQLSWTRRPDFSFAIGTREDLRTVASAFRLEAWDRDL